MSAQELLAREYLRRKVEYLMSPVVPSVFDQVDKHWLRPIEFLERAEELFEVGGVPHLLECADEDQAIRVNALHRKFCEELEVVLFGYRGRPQLHEGQDV